MPRYQLRKNGVDLVVIEEVNQIGASRRAARFGAGCTAAPIAEGAGSRLVELRESSGSAATEAAEARLAEGLRRFGGLSEEGARVAARGRGPIVRQEQPSTGGRLPEPAKRIEEAQGRLARGLQRFSALTESAAQIAAKGRAR